MEPSTRFDSPHTALKDVSVDDMTIAVGRFGLSGIPRDLTQEVRDAGVTELTIVSSNMAWTGEAWYRYRRTSRCAKSSGRPSSSPHQYLHGLLDVEFAPQGTLAERITYRLATVG
jgi:3-oxoacid CoA-transferase subunit A